MKRLASICRADLGDVAAMALVAPTAVSSAAVDTADASIPVDPVTTLEMHATANCVKADKPIVTSRRRPTCSRRTARSDFPRDVLGAADHHAATMDRSVYLDSDFDAPNTRMFKSQWTDVEFSDDLLRRRTAREVHAARQHLAPPTGRTGQPQTDADYIVCSHIQVVYAGVNLTSPDACAQTTYSLRASVCRSRRPEAAFRTCHDERARLTYMQ